MVLALIAIMATMTVPFLGSWLQHYRVMGAAREIASMLQEARIRAIANNREFRVVVDIDNNTIWIEQGDKVDGSGNWIRVGGVESIPKRVNITAVGSVTTGQRRIKFNPNGTAASNSIYLTGENGEVYRLTVLSTTGRVWIRMKKGSGWVPV